MTRESGSLNINTPDNDPTKEEASLELETSKNLMWGDKPLPYKTPTIAEEEKPRFWHFGRKKEPTATDKPKMRINLLRKNVIREDSVANNEKREGERLEDIESLRRAEEFARARRAERETRLRTELENATPAPETWTDEDEKELEEIKRLLATLKEKGQN